VLEMDECYLSSEILHSQSSLMNNDHYTDNHHHYHNRVPDSKLVCSELDDKPLPIQC